MKILFRSVIYFFALIGFILTSGFFAIKFGITNEWGTIDEQREAFLKSGYMETNVVWASTTPVQKKLPWEATEEWQTIEEALRKDEHVIKEAAKQAGVNPRLIVAQVAVEQLRLFTTNRELFKTVFAPLKILGVQSQFSWGVIGIKEETAIQVENYLKDQSSPFYLGKEYEHLLDFKTENHGEERFMRIIDEDNRHYSYLYAGLHLKQLEIQWKNAGHNISNRPEILSTLFNIGFKYSKPNMNPKSGGALITIEGTGYSFGSLAGEFYHSNELVDIFPK